MKRRLFLFAAPAIVAAPSLMRVSALHLEKPLELLLAPNLPPIGGIRSDNTVWYSGYESRHIPPELILDSLANNRVYRRLLERAKIGRALRDEVTGFTDILRG